jgi:hypothetical protein
VLGQRACLAAPLSFRTLQGLPCPTHSDRASLPAAVEDSDEQPFRSANPERHDGVRPARLALAGRLATIVA